MPEDDEFEGRPWNAEPTDEWNRVPYWADYYRELMNESDDSRRDLVLHRETSALRQALRALGWLPFSGQPPRVLDAGCGIALIPRLFAYWGYQVTAVDLCPGAIAIAKTYQADEVELAKCIDLWRTETGRSYSRVIDPKLSLRELREACRPGGSVRYLVADWHDAQFRPGSFDFIHCRNSLRLSPKRYWRQTLLRFHELLAPSGVLFLENVNAIDIQGEVEALAREAGFWVSAWGWAPTWGGPPRDPSGGKTFLGFWPTG